MAGFVFIILIHIDLTEFNFLIMVLHQAYAEIKDQISGAIVTLVIIYMDLFWLLVNEKLNTKLVVLFIIRLTNSVKVKRLTKPW